MCRTSQGKRCSRIRRARARTSAALSWRKPPEIQGPKAHLGGSRAGVAVGGQAFGGGAADQAVVEHLVGDGHGPGAGVAVREVEGRRGRGVDQDGIATAGEQERDRFVGAGAGGAEGVLAPALDLLAAQVRAGEAFTEAVEMLVGFGGPAVVVGEAAVREFGDTERENGQAAVGVSYVGDLAQRPAVAVGQFHRERGQAHPHAQGPEPQGHRVRRLFDDASAVVWRGDEGCPRRGRDVVHAQGDAYGRARRGPQPECAGASGGGAYVQGRAAGACAGDGGTDDRVECARPGGDQGRRRGDVRRVVTGMQ